MGYEITTWLTMENSVQICCAQTYLHISANREHPLHSDTVSTKKL